LVAALFAGALLRVGGRPAWADSTNQTLTANPLSATSSATPVVLPFPTMSGPLTASPNPFHLDINSLGSVYLTGVVSGLLQWQTNAVPRDHTTRVDVSNAQFYLQKPDGLIQFLIHTGLYAQPSLGMAYVKAVKTTEEMWGPLPEAFLTVAPTTEFSIMAGKLPSLPGLENTFTFQNLNIERGLLWNQTNSVNRGVQANYSHGPVSFAFSWNDGFYSNCFSWLSGSATWKIADSDQFVFIGAGNLRTVTKSNAVTPLLQDNSQMYNAIFTRTAGRWIFSPYLQYTYIPRSGSIGAPYDLATYGAALLGSYTFDSASNLGGVSLDGISLPFRAEYIASRGSVAGAGLLYGGGSVAWSVTVTPTYQYERFFARAEFSFVEANHTKAGFAFGSHGTDTTQTRLLLETGFLF
jgi:hypothetical protein